MHLSGLGLRLLVSVVIANQVSASVPAGLDGRLPVGAYMDGNLPDNASAPMPALLSQTGVFTNTLLMTPHAGLVPYGINSPLWSDNATKGRWIGLPSMARPPRQ